MPTIKTKSAIIIIATFILGLALGLVSSQHLIRKRLEPLRHVEEGPRIGMWLERSIQPTDKQREAIKEITGKYRRRMIELRKEHQRDNRKILDSLMGEIKPLLNEDQIKRFERLKRHQDAGGKMRKGIHPEGRKRMKRP